MVTPSLSPESMSFDTKRVLFHAIRETIEGRDVSQEAAARRLGLTRPRLNDLLRGKLAKVSLDALVHIAASAHLEVEIR